jgi:hypothetical protein
MNIEQRIYALGKRLIALGYYPFQVKNIIQDVIGNIQLEDASPKQRIQVINVLENYEKLGNEFLLCYSK